MTRFPDQPPLICYSHKIRSRYGETDQMGYVYYGRYLDYFEEARTEMIRSFGLSYSELEKSGIMLPVTSASIGYKSPVFYDEEMRIDVILFELPQVRLKTFYRVFTGRQETPHVTGQVNLAFIESETRRPCRVPDDFLNRLRAETG